MGILFVMYVFLSGLFVALFFKDRFKYDDEILREDGYLPINVAIGWVIFPFVFLFYLIKLLH